MDNVKSDRPITEPTIQFLLITLLSQPKLKMKVNINPPKAPTTAAATMTEINEIGIVIIELKRKGFLPSFHLVDMPFNFTFRSFDQSKTTFDLQRALGMGIIRRFFR